MLAVVDRKTAFHVHTKLCGHATGEIYEYIDKAISLGIKRICFTDHAPFPGNDFKGRMDMTELPKYLGTLNRLKYELKDVIEIRTGFEIEHLENFKDYISHLSDTPGVDIMLLGVHFGYLKDRGKYNFELEDKNYEPIHLAKNMVFAMYSGLYDAVAHPDLLFKRKRCWDYEADEVSKELWRTAVINDIPFEVNMSSVMNSCKKKKEGYFWPEFWSLAPDDAKIIYGLDAHSPEELEQNYRLMQVIMKREIRRLSRAQIIRDVHFVLNK